MGPVCAALTWAQAGKYLKERDVIIEFFENEADFKPLTLSGNSPATKLFLKDLKAAAVVAAASR